MVAFTELLYIPLLGAQRHRLQLCGFCAVTPPHAAYPFIRFSTGYWHTHPSNCLGRLNMSIRYQLLPTTDPESLSSGEEARVISQSFSWRIRRAFNEFERICQAHAEALNNGWLDELERLGGPVFVCFMLLRLGLLSLTVFWGLFIASPLWLMSLVSNERFLLVALQLGLVITLIIILEPLPFVGLMSDPRSKIFHCLYAAYLVLAWREACVFLVPQETLGQVVAQPWVKDFCYAVAAASSLGCAMIGWTVWDGFSRQQYF